MIQPGKNLPLGTKAADDGLGVHPPLEDLQRHPLAEDVVIAHRQVHGAHAALAELAHEPVGADARVDRRSGASL